MAGTEQRLGFVGLGAMGMHMARNMAQALDAPVNVCDVSAAAVEAAGEWGGVACASPADVAQASDIVITMVPADHHVRSVFLGDGGLIEGAHKNLIAIDFSTIGAWTITEIAEAFAETGAVAFGGAATRGVPAAKAGTLTVFVDSDPPAFETAKPVIEAFSEIIVQTGAIGSSKVMKILNNLMVGVNVAATAEAVALAGKVGIPAETLIRLIQKGSGSSYAMDNHFAKNLLSANIGPGIFPTDYILKDLRLAGEMARRQRHTLHFGALAMAVYRGTGAMGYDKHYYPAALRWMERGADMEALTPMPDNAP
jgi:3-hydroxyisobutyrate dehydrogenase-like beta-hydroxyacid dehydrogenase